MKFLISGGTGYLGGFLAQELLSQGHSVYSLTRRPHPELALEKRFYELDFPKHPSSPGLFSLTKEVSPDVIIHCAAMSSPSECEKNPNQTFLFNTQLPCVWAKEAAKLGTSFIFLSTDLVFEAYPESPEAGFSEKDQPKTYSVYAESKLKAESLILSLPKSSVVRTALILGPPYAGKSGTLGWLQNAIKAGVDVPLYTDEYRTPVYVSDLARFLRVLSESRESGLFHAAGPDKLSRYKIGKICAEALGLSMENLKELSRLEHKASPSRAPDVALNASVVENTFEIKFNRIKDALEADKEKFLL
ncbi:MAG: SDR family oxidoreductase [Bdellovibrionota bacterium]